MADDERTTTDGATAVLGRPSTTLVSSSDAPPAPTNKRGKKKAQKDIDEYEVEFATPFGKVEFEFEPKSTKERKDQEKREKQALDAAKAEDKAHRNAEKLAKKGIVAAASVTEPGRGGGNLLPILLIFALVVGAVALAIWLFARPGDAGPDRVPAEFLNDAPVDPTPQPAGFAAKAQARIRDAVRAGRQASRETQDEQQKKFEDLTGSR